VITAVDSSVLLDFFAADPQFGAAASGALRRASTEGQVVACDVVWGEVGAAFASADVAAAAMARLAVGFSPLTREAALRAAEAWRAYRRAGGSRQRMIADFLIAAHAAEQADRLLTRDRGFYRSHFPNLAILAPGRE
jgi:predicted nucleic acid-binding protein